MKELKCSECGKQIEDKVFECDIHKYNNEEEKCNKILCEDCVKYEHNSTKESLVELHFCSEHIKDILLEDDMYEVCEICEQKIEEECTTFCDKCGRIMCEDCNSYSSDEDYGNLCIEC